MSTGRTRHDGKDRFGRGDRGDRYGGERYGSDRGGYRGRSPPSRGPPPRRGEYGRDSRRGGEDGYEYRRKRYSRYEQRTGLPVNICLFVTEFV